MLAILSPARNSRPVIRADFPPDSPLFQEEAAGLAAVLRDYSPWELESLLDVNGERALAFYDCYQRFSRDAPGTPALLSYQGAAFRSMGPDGFDRADLEFAQEHLRIMSALYGLLRPRDGIQPYRLGMGKQFRVDGKDLYAFWGEKLYRELFRTGEPVVSLTSADYGKLITPYLSPADQLITCRFLIRKPDGVRGTVSTVRTARGLMARFIVKNRITSVEDLKEFDSEGYRFSASRSDFRTLAFVRDPR